MCERRERGGTICVQNDYRSNASRWGSNQRREAPDYQTANALGLSPEEPAEIYSAIRENRDSDSGRDVSPNEQRLVYTRVFEVAIVNASLSKDEFAVLAHLRNQFNINDDDHARIEADLRDMIRQKTEDENVVEKLLGTLKDSVSLVGSLFDSVRTKSA